MSLLQHAPADTRELVLLLGGGTARRGARSGERGSASAWMITASAGLIACAGLVVDLGGQLHAQQRAYGIAAQAARTAGQQIAVPEALAGDGLTVDPGAASAAAEGFLADAGVSGFTVVDGNRITVTVVDTYAPQILGRFGIGPFPVEVSATARLVHAVGGVER